MPRLIDRASRLALDLFFPPRCALCGSCDSLLCDGCAAALPLAAGHRCEVCWMPAAGGNVCWHCAEAPPAFVSLRSACVMEGGARSLTHMLKYEGLSALAEPMAELMTPPALADIDVIVPVPLHGRRRRSRGYNQSEELARHIAAGMGTPLNLRVLRRPKATQPLVKAMSRDERRQIVAGAFVASDDAAGRSILLIDDVATTGATLDACATALLAAGAAEVRCLTWARAD